MICNILTGKKNTQNEENLSQINQFDLKMTPNGRWEKMVHFSQSLAGHIFKTVRGIKLIFWHVQEDLILGKKLPWRRVMSFDLSFAHVWHVKGASPP